MQMALDLNEGMEREAATGEACPVELVVMPWWFDDDLHGAALDALSGEWVTLGEIKASLGEWADRACDIMRDVVSLELAAVEVRPYIYYGTVVGGKAYYRKA